MSVALPRARAGGAERIAGAIREHAGEIVPVALVTAIAFALRVSQVHQSLFGDEVFSYGDVIGRSFRTVVTTVHTGGENSPPLFFVLAWASSKLGDPTVWIRLPSLVLGSATVPLAYLVGRETVGRVAAMIGAAIVALAPFSVFYGIEARPYATMTFFVALSTWALLHAVRRGAARWWILYAFAAAAAAYTHYTSIFVLLAQALWSLWACRGRVRTAVIANAAIVVAYGPWLPHVRGKALGVIAALYPLTFQRVVTDLLRPIPGAPAAPLRAIPTIGGLIAVCVCVLAGAAALAIRWRADRRAAVRIRPMPSATTALVVLIAVATPIGLILYSLLVTDIWLPRGLSASLPAAALVLGALLAALPRPLTIVTAAVVVVVLAAGTLRSFDAAYARGPYRTIASYLDRVARPSDPVIVVSFAGGPAVLAQFQRPHLVIASLPLLWKLTRLGGVAYVMLDRATAAPLHLRTPHPAGFQLLTDRRYPGPIPAELITYRRLAPSRTP